MAVGMFFGGKVKKELQALRQEHERLALAKEQLDQTHQELQSKFEKTTRASDEALREEIRVRIEADRRAREEQELIKEHYEALLHAARAEAASARRDAQEAQSAKANAQEEVAKESRLASEEKFRLTAEVEKAWDGKRSAEQEALAVRQEEQRLKAEVKVANYQQAVDLKAREEAWAQYEERSPRGLKKDSSATPNVENKTSSAMMNKQPPLGTDVSRDPQIADLQEENGRLRADLVAARADLRKLEALRTDFLRLSEELLIARTRSVGPLERPEEANKAHKLGAAEKQHPFGVGVVPA